MQIYDQRTDEFSRQQHAESFIQTAVVCMKSSVTKWHAGVNVTSHTESRCQIFTPIDKAAEFWQEKLWILWLEK